MGVGFNEGFFNNLLVALIELEIITRRTISLSFVMHCCHVLLTFLLTS